jgi:GNAT superfamily N-acetyltransferase
MLRFSYRILQKLAVFEVARTFTVDTACLSAGSQQAEVIALDQESLALYLERGEAPGCEPFIERLSEQGLHAFGAIVDGELASFAWLHEGLAEAGMNYGYHPGTATAIHLADDAAFVFHIYTAPQFRGRGLMGAVLRGAASRLLAERGVRTLVTTTETINDAARAGFARLGFEDCGAYCRFGLPRWTTGWYPRPAAPILAFG